MGSGLTHFSIPVVFIFLLIHAAYEIMMAGQSASEQKQGLETDCPEFSKSSNFSSDASLAFWLPTMLWLPTLSMNIAL
jgi:hypothetical protein